MIVWVTFSGDRPAYRLKLEVGQGAATATATRDTRCEEAAWKEWSPM